MDEWKFQQRRRKRGLHCLVHCVTADGVRHGKLCGCGGTGWLPHPLLAHLRSPGPHVRGCWAIDRLTGRE